MQICSMEKREAAKTLYLEGYTQKRIAIFFRLSEKTIGNWAKEGNWKEHRVKLEIFHNNSASNLMEIFEYQVLCLKKKKDELLESGGELTPFSSGDFDGLQKLYSTIKSNQKKWSDYVSVVKEFTEYVSQYDTTLAQSIIEQGDNFLNEKRKSI